MINKALRNIISGIIKSRKQILRNGIKINLSIVQKKYNQFKRIKPIYEIIYCQQMIHIIRLIQINYQIQLIKQFKSNFKTCYNIFQSQIMSKNKQSEYTYQNDSQKLYIINPQQNQNIWKPKFDKFLKKRSEYYLTMLQTKSITEDQMKVQFSKEILNSVFGTLGFQKVDQLYINTVQKNLKQNLSFLKVIYPRNKKTQVATELVEGIKQCDYLDKVDNDLMAIHNTLFDYRQDQKDKDILVLDQIRNFLNVIIEQLKMSVGQFKDIMKIKLPQSVSLQAKQKLLQIMNDNYKFKLGSKLPDDHPKLLDFGSQKLKLHSNQMFRIIVKWIEDISSLVQKTQQFMLKRNYLKKFYYVNTKGNQTNSQNNSVKSDHQIQNKQEGFFSGIFSRIKNICTTTNQRLAFQQQDIARDFLQKTKSRKTGIKFQSLRYNIPGSPINNIIDGMSALTPQKSLDFVKIQLEALQKKYMQIINIIQKNEKIGKLSMQEKKIYGFSQYTYEFLEEIVVDRLVDLIKVLIDFRIYQKKKLDTKQTFENIDLISFRITDLLRGRIMLNQKMLFQVFEGLQNLHLNGNIQIVKVKNRFNQPMNDCIILFKLKNSKMICELQLILFKQKSESQSKEKAFQILNHYFYELQRATYGPLSQLSMIIATKDHRINCLKQIGRKKPDVNSNICNCVEGLTMSNETQQKYYYSFQQQQLNVYAYDDFTKKYNINLTKWRQLMPKSFICGVCQRVYGKGQNPFPIQICQKCNFALCSQCQFQIQASSEESKYQIIINVLLNIMERKKQYQDEEQYENLPYFIYQFEAQTHEKITQEQNQQYITISIMRNYIRFKSQMSSSKFWAKVRLQFQKIFRTVKKSQTFQSYGILIQISEIFTLTNIPIKIFKYNLKEKKLNVLYYQKGKVQEEQVNYKDIKLKQFDVFYFIQRPADNDSQQKASIYKKILDQWCVKILKQNLFYKRTLKSEDLIDDNVKVKKELAKLTNVYDKQIHLNNMELKKLKIPQQFQSKVKNIKFLNLNDNYITNIQNIYQLENLEDLRIQKNQIQQLDLNGRFPYLEHLYFSSNYIKKLIIVGQKHLKIIQGQQNYYKSFQIRNLIMLNELKLSITGYGSQNQQTEGFLDNLQRLSFLKIQQIKFTKGTSTLDCQRYPQLNQLFISYSNLNILSLNDPNVDVQYVEIKSNQKEVDILRKSNIKYLVIQDTPVKKMEIPKQSIKFDVYPSQVDQIEPMKIQITADNLNTLRYLGISTSQHQYIQTNGLFSSIETNAPLLQQLHLAQEDQQKHLKQEGNFINFKKLKKISLYNMFNNIETMPQEIQQFEWFYENFYPMSFSPNNISLCYKLKSIILQNIGINNVPVPNSCQKLQLNSNDLSQLKIENQNNLKDLMIYQSKKLNIQNLEKCNLINLTNLELYECNISKFCFKTKLVNLKNLSLRNNLLSSIEWLANQSLNSLQTLDVAQNKIQKLVLCNFQTLRYLYIQQNPLNQLQKDVQKIGSNINKLAKLSQTLTTFVIFPIKVNGNFKRYEQMPKQLHEAIQKNINKNFTYVTSVK